MTVKSKTDYDKRTYKRIILTLRYDSDSDLIESFFTAQKQGLKSREWIRSLMNKEVE